MHRIIDQDGEQRSILRNIQKLTLDGIKRQVMKIWHNDTHTSTLPKDFTTTAIDPANDQAHKLVFYRCTRSTMIAKCIMGSISTSSRKTLFTKRKEFARMDYATGEYNYNRPTILHFLMASINPNTRVGVTGLKEKIRMAKIGSFNHNVKDLLTDIASNYNLIVEQGFSHNNVVMDTFNALPISKNVEFSAYVQHHKDAWEEGKTFTLDGISVDASSSLSSQLFVLFLVSTGLPLFCKVVSLLLLLVVLLVSLSLVFNFSKCKPHNRESAFPTDVVNSFEDHVYCCTSTDPDI